MLRKIHNDELGFTLVEILVVILIIGILAAIALPTFLGQQKKGQDAAAKSNARNVVSQVEACFADTPDYTQCDSASVVGTTGLPWGTGAGQVAVTTATSDTFTVEGVSASSNKFQINRLAAGGYSRTCTNAGSGGCRTDGTW